MDLNSEADVGDVQREELSFFQLLRLIWARRWMVAILAIAGSIVGAAWSFLITPQYQTKSVVMPVISTEGAGANLQGLMGQLGGIANLVGANVPGGQAREEAVEFLQSRYITERFISANGLLPVLFPERWDASARQWKQSRSAPTMGQAYKRFVTRIRSIREDRRSGLVTVTITWRDQEQAASWANGLIQMANSELRRRAVEEAKGSINYLNAELAKTQVVELQQAIYRLIESQIRTIMLANVREQYAFKVIDPAVVPDATERVRPRRVAMTVTGLFVGLIVAVLWILMAFATGRPIPVHRATAA